MAGLCAAARARELGARPVLLEKGDRPGGSMVLSSCVVWRDRSLDDFRRGCPGGEPALQRVGVELLDEGVGGLRPPRGPVLWGGRGKPRPRGPRFHPRG